MKEIKCEYFERGKTTLRQRTGRRFLVLPDCYEPFKRELNGLMALRILVERYATKNWLIRFLWASDAVFQAQFFIDRRHHTFWQTVKFATRVTIIFSSPDWIQEKLTPLWRRDYAKERNLRAIANLMSRDAAPTPAL